MKTQNLYPRHLRPRILEALSDSPVVLIHGPRQCGKTTLARLVGDAEGLAYLSFDDDVQRAAAQADPVGYVADLPERAVLDEVQRVPELFTSLKAALDARREPGRYIRLPTPFIPSGGGDHCIVPLLGGVGVGFSVAQEKPQQLNNLKPGRRFAPLGAKYL